jgi:hypothetical protein
MIYEQIENPATNSTLGRKIAILKKELELLENTYRDICKQIVDEDSKKRVLELRTERDNLTNRRRVIWGEMEFARTEAFKKALAEEYGIISNPKFEKAFDIAWQQGHSSGYSEVENYFSDLVDLIK